MKVKLSLFALLISVVSHAQNGKDISGIIKDNFNEEAMGVVVQLKSTDDKFIKGTTSEMDGSFIINEVADGKYKLVLTLVGMQPITKDVEIAGKDVNLGIVKFGKNTNNLKEVTVVSSIIAAKQDNDTSSFNADAYKVNPDATAEDLVKKMPGIDLSSGQVKAQGEAVGKVLVDGKPFFGDDASSTLKNMPAEVISKIQVYDEKSDQSRLTGVDDGETIKTINIVTRPEKRQGVFGRAYAGAGGDMDKNFRYNAGGNINSFNGDRRISIIGQSNNVNLQNFNSQDLLGISGGSGGRGGFRGGRGGGGNNGFFVNAQDGIAKTNAFGINYSDKLGEKVELTASYFFNNTNNTSIQETYRQYVVNDDGAQEYSENSVANTNNFNHRINSRLTYTIDSNNTLIWVPSLSFQSNKGTSSLLGKSLGDNNTVINQTNNDFKSELNGYNFTNFLSYFHKFNKAGRSFNIRSKAGSDQNKGNNNFYAENMYSLPTLTYDTLDQYSTLNKTGWNIDTRIQYTEPIYKNLGIAISYENEYQKTNAAKLTNNFDPITNTYSLQDSLLSNTFMSTYITNSLGLRLTYADKKIRFNAGAEFQKASLKSDRELPFVTKISRDYPNILPRLMFRYNISKTKNLGIFYRTSTDAPSITQLQDVIDNTNPLQLSSGNPNLKQSYSHMLFGRYSSSNANNNSTFFAMLRGSLTNDYITNSTIIAANDTVIKDGIVLPKGGQYATQENMDGYYSINAFTTYSTPITALKSNLNISLNGGISRVPGLINLQKNFSYNRSAGLGLVFSSNISEKIDFTVSSNTNLNFIKNTLNSNADNQYLNQTTRLNANYIFLNGFVLNTDLSHQYYKGLSAGFNQNYLLWNASIGKKIFKKQQGEIRLSVFDLLGQNTSIVPTFTETYNQTVRTNALQRYFMLTFTYNIRAFNSGSAQDSNADDQRNFRPGGSGRPGMPPHQGNQHIF